MDYEITKELAYVLGFIWADGCLNKIKNKYYRCVIECNYDDLQDIEHIFHSTSIIWNKSFRQRMDRKKQMILSTYDKEFCTFLSENDYEYKGIKSPDKILGKIPEIYHIYFYRGIIDGDGCFYVLEKNNTAQFSICSSIEQDWSYISQFFDKYCIRYIISKYNNKKKHKNSSIRICSKYDIVQFGNLLYNCLDSIYLKRKKNKFDQICSFVSVSNFRGKIDKKSKNIEKSYIYSECDINSAI